jgi:hypothetical protein
LGFARPIVVAQFSKPACRGLPETDANVYPPASHCPPIRQYSTENSEEPFGFSSSVGATCLWNPDSEVGKEIEKPCREPIVGRARHSVRAGPATSACKSSPASPCRPAADQDFARVSRTHLGVRIEPSEEKYLLGPPERQTVMNAFPQIFTQTLSPNHEPAGLNPKLFDLKPSTFNLKPS